MTDITRHFHPILDAASLRRKPVRVELGGRAWALFRDGSGRAAALADRCPHRFAPLSMGSVRGDGRLACPYHGWHFGADGDAIAPSQPTLRKCRVDSLRVVERHGYIWAADPSTGDDALPDLAAIEADGYQLAGAFSQRFEAPLAVCLDNFSEDEHVPYVHSFLGWDERDLGRMRFEAKNHPDRTEVSYSAPQRLSPWLPALLLRPGDWFHNQWVTRFSPVHAVFDLHWTAGGPTGPRRPVSTRVPIFMVPVDDATTMFHVFVFVRLERRRLSPLMPVVRAAGLHIAKNEIRDDARFVRHLATATPDDLLEGRLGKFDKPLIHNRKLLASHYFGRGGLSVLAGEG